MSIEKVEEEKKIMGVNKPKDIQVMNLVNKILLKGLQQGVAEMHIEPHKDGCYIRFRKDGLLHQACDPISNQIASAMIDCLKNMANLEINAENKPQQGKIKKIFQSKTVNFRLSSLPCPYGEKMVLKLSYHHDQTQTLEQLILYQPTLELVKQMLNSPSGLILVTGLPKSGKKTTLYSLVSQLNEYGANISTVENPIELILPRINQFEVCSSQGMDYDAIVQYLLEQSADVILVDQTKTLPTAKMLCYAALSDCLVMSSILHHGDSVSAIASFQNMGIDASILAEALVGIINQRLIKRICPQCRIPYHLSKAELARFGKYVDDEEEITFYKAKTLNIPQIERAKTKGTLCPNCQGMGYKGEIAVMEVLPINQHLKALIAQNADYPTLKNAATKAGITSLFAYALELGYLGLTSLEEIEKIFPAEIKAIDTNSNSPNTISKIASLEKLIFQLNRELKYLKHELNNHGTVSSVPPQKHLSKLDDLPKHQQKINLYDTKLETSVNDLKKDEKISISDEVISLDEGQQVSINTVKSKPKKSTKPQQQKPNKAISENAIIPDPW